MTAIKITLRQIRKVYDRVPADQPPALDNVSLDIAEGDICVLMGLSGSGKSTLLRTINGLVRPSSGQVLVDGVDLAGLTPARLQALRRDSMGMVFQSSALFLHRTVIDNAAFGLEIAGVDRAERVRRASAVLEQVGLLANAAQYPHQLSGGMRQRVGLARALAVDPSLLLMDEAFSALDPIKRRAMQELLLTLQSERARTIVFVSHDIDEALRLGQQIALLEGGRLLQQGAPRELLGAPADERVRAFFSGADTSAHLRACDLIDLHAGAGVSVGAEAEAGAGAASSVGKHTDSEGARWHEHPSVAADTPLAELMPRLTGFQTPLTVRDRAGAALGLITAASALRIISRASARG